MYIGWKRDQHIDKLAGRIDALADDANLSLDGFIACTVEPAEMNDLIRLEVRRIFRLNAKLHLDAIFRGNLHERRAGGDDLALLHVDLVHHAGHRRMQMLLCADATLRQAAEL